MLKTWHFSNFTYFELELCFSNFTSHVTNFHFWTYHYSSFVCFQTWHVSNFFNGDNDSTQIDRTFRMIVWAFHDSTCPDLFGNISNFFSWHSSIKFLLWYVTSKFQQFSLGCYLLLNWFNIWLNQRIKTNQSYLFKNKVYMILILK